MLYIKVPIMICMVNEKYSTQIVIFNSYCCHVKKGYMHEYEKYSMNFVTRLNMESLCETGRQDAQTCHGFTKRMGHLSLTFTSEWDIFQTITAYNARKGP